MTFLCPHDRTPLDGSLHCATCKRTYAIENGIADFSEGNYYDAFEPGTALPEEHLRGLEQEVFGTRWRIEQFYLPRLAGATKVLDCGCGNGLAVDLLAERGIEAWGIDLSALRKWQWRERLHRDRLAVASALALPFPDASFDVVVSSGVIEHIGVAETGGATYSVRPLPDRDAQRQRYIDELLRVVRPGGRVYVDAPNGAFPIDFWHSHAGGKARWHPTNEGFLPKFEEIVRLVGPRATVRALSPHRRFAFKQVGRYWYGRLGAMPIELLFRAMTLPLASGLARTRLNPFLIVQIDR
jgi:SAM-dependent methyltransferase